MPPVTTASIGAGTAISTMKLLKQRPDDGLIVVVIFTVALAIVVGIWLGKTHKY